MIIVVTGGSRKLVKGVLKKECARSAQEFLNNKAITFIIKESLRRGSWVYSGVGRYLTVGGPRYNICARKNSGPY